MNKDTLKLLRNQTLFRCFLSLRDPRVQGRCLHPLFNIIVITIVGLICGADTWKDIEKVAQRHKRWLSRHLDLTNGIPSHFTIARVLSLIEPTDFQRCFMNWVNEIVPKLADDVIAIDGKTVRGSSHKAGNKKALHIINAFSTNEKLTLGEAKTPDKSNEIKGIPVLLKKLDIKNLIISMDAMGTQKGIANLIRKKQAHYVLALKKNHRRMYRRIEKLYNRADELNYEAMTFRQERQTDYGHGRIEEREYTILPVMYEYRYKAAWRDLSFFIRVKSTRICVDKEEHQSRYYFSSVPYKKYDKAIRAIRQHWMVENTLHYKLDVGLHEDQCQIYRGHAAQNLATMRKIVLYLLQKENTSREGIASKRLQAALSTRYLRKVIGF